MNSARFYLSYNELKSEPDCVWQHEFIHVKAKSDGSQTIIISAESLEYPEVIELTRECAQDILNAWIDQENESAPVDDSGNLIRQSYINLGVYLAQ